MKRFLLFVFSILLTFTFAIAQDGINYQGAATDANGDELTNQNITIRASVLSTTANGNLEWEETHSATTDPFGLFNVVIGQGTNTTNGATATFDDMDWGSGNHFLKIEMDATGGTNYAMIGTTQMMSVPYALYAKSAGIDSTMLANMIGSSGGGMGGSAFGDMIDIQPNVNPNQDFQINQDGFLLATIQGSNGNCSGVMIKDSALQQILNYYYCSHQQLFIPIKSGQYLNYWGSVNLRGFIPLEGGGSSSSSNGLDSATVATMIANAVSASNSSTSVSTFGDTLYINGQAIIVPGISVQNFPSSLMGSVTDVDGNTYPTITLGNQEWMAANLNTTHFANGNNLNDNSGSNGDCSSQPGYKDNLTGDNFRYYNALAVHDSRNVCPTGWHVPSKAEFETLLGMFGYFSNSDWIGSAVALKSTEPFAWEYSVTSNASMLNFKRDGIIYCGLNQISHTTESWTWTSTATDPNNTNDIHMTESPGSNNNSNVSIPSHGNAYNLPIRCVKD